MPAVRVPTPNVTHVNTSQPGARVMPSPQRVDLGTKMGAVAHPGHQGVVNPRHGTPAQPQATTVVRKQPAPPQVRRPGVAPRPTSGGGIVRPGGNPGTTVRVIVPEPAAPIVEPTPAITPLTIEQMMMLSHLCDAFILQQTEVDPTSKYIAAAASTKTALETWMGAITDGSAQVVPPPAPVQAAPVIAPVATAPANSSAPIVTPAAPASPAAPAAPATATHPTGTSE